MIEKPNKFSLFLLIKELNIIKIMNVTTDTDSVQIISCTYQKVISNAPYIFLWSFSALEYYYVKKNKTNSIPWGILNTSKIICNFLCLCVTTVNLITNFLGYQLISKSVIFTLIQLLTFVSPNNIFLNYLKIN